MGHDNRSITILVIGLIVLVSVGFVGAAVLLSKPVPDVLAVVVATGLGILAPSPLSKSAVPPQGRN